MEKGTGRIKKGLSHGPWLGPGWALAGPWLGPALIKVQRNLSREVRKGPVYFYPELRFALA